MSELGSMLDMTCFFCNKCHNLLLAEVDDRASALLPVFFSL